MNPTQDLRKVTRWLQCPIVYIHVGSSSQEFAVHKDLICYTSPFFRAAFTSGFQETNTGTMKLPETDTEIFDLFMGWLYTRELMAESTLGIEDPIERSGKNKCSEEDPPERNETFKRKIQALMNALENETWKSEAETLFEDTVGKRFLDNLAAQVNKEVNNKIYTSMSKTLGLYIFADMAQIPALKNCCIKKYDELRRGIKNQHDGHDHDHDDFGMTLGSISNMWKNTRDSDLMRMYLLDSVSWRSEPSIQEEVIRKRDRGSQVDDLERYFEKVDEDS
ncbi:uncharacterized protein EAF01_009789 [Botrytis porri]|uniref:uncharacterized protein n=1 Tax=Botrytis porri TaxID=87229 RepID=UPI001901CA06|nr:uncharacterized protein EAF01_009789 [Botrytis porri]KAF7895827.1 hypothetical protein EAF01_009789 [Botrytis porri]